MKKVWVHVVILLLLAVPAGAVTVVNGDFEDTNLTVWNPKKTAGNTIAVVPPGNLGGMQGLRALRATVTNPDPVAPWEAAGIKQVFPGAFPPGNYVVSFLARKMSSGDTGVTNFQCGVMVNAAPWESMAWIGVDMTSFPMFSVMEYGQSFTITTPTVDLCIYCNFGALAQDVEIDNMRIDAADDVDSSVVVVSGRVTLSEGITNADLHIIREGASAPRETFSFTETGTWRATLPIGKRYVITTSHPNSVPEVRILDTYPNQNTIKGMNFTVK